MKSMTNELITRSRRRGFILPTALAIVLLGASLAMGIITLAHYMYAVDTVARRDYDDRIEVRNFIEEAKGFIIAENTLRSNDVTERRYRDFRTGTVLHGQKGEDGSLKDYFEIKSMEDLQVCYSGSTPLNAISRDFEVGTGDARRRIVLRVYDLNYDPASVDVTSAKPGWDFPPSLMPPAEYDKDETEFVRASAEEQGDDNIRSTFTSGKSDEYFADYYRNFGAYLIRVDVYLPGSNRTRPVRRMEEAFYVKIGTAKN